MLSDEIQACYAVVEPFKPSNVFYFIEALKFHFSIGANRLLVCALSYTVQDTVIITRDERIWRYIDTVSIRRLTIRIVAQLDISRYDLDICNKGKSPRCL